MYVFGVVPLVDGAPSFSVEHFSHGYPKPGVVGAFPTPKRECSETEFAEIHVVIDQALKDLLKSHGADLMPLACTNLSKLGEEIFEQNTRLQSDLSETENEIETYEESLARARVELEERRSSVKSGEEFKEKYAEFMRVLGAIDNPTPGRG